MKREELKKLLGDGVEDTVIDKIMAMNGSDIEGFKSKLTATESERDGFKNQLTEANKQIEDFKKLDIDGVKKAADEWKTKFETAQEETAKQVSDLKFNHALDGALTTAKAKNAKVVKALLNMENLKLNDADGSIIGLDDQLKTIKEGNDYLFEPETPDPKIVASTPGGGLTGLSALEASAYKGAGLPLPK